MEMSDFLDMMGPFMDGDPVPMQEQMEVLRGLGLEISEAAAQKLPPEGAYWMTLESLGWGSYDFDTNAWTPSSRQLYSFDSEVPDIETMYLTYFKGLQAISEGELTFTEVCQDHSQVDWDGPGGKVAVTFRLNGEACRFDAEFMGDWLDLTIRGAVNRVLARQGIEKRFFATDASQGETIFFCTAEWAKRLEAATQCRMSDGME